MRVCGENIADAVSRPAQTRPRFRRAGAGVTLIELVAVLAMLGLIAAIALPRLADADLWMAEGEAAACKLAATLRLARRLSIENAATNALGYAVIGTKTAYQILDLGGGQAGEWIPLPDGWQFDMPNYNVMFDAYGGVRLATASPEGFVIGKDAQSWIVGFDPATGYVWHEPGKE